MEVSAYRDETKESIIQFLRDRKQVIQSELVRLGTERRCINWQTLKLIIEELENDEQIRITRLGRKVVMYEWIGE